MKKMLYLFAFFISSQLTSQISSSQLDQYFQRMVEDWKVPSITIGIVQNGALVYSKGFGVKEIGKPGLSDGNTLYAIASNSKAFTSAMIAMLVEEGKLEWDQKVVDILPFFELSDPCISEMVTIRDLLCHRVGLGTFSGDAIWYKSNLSAEAIIKRIKHLPPAYEFRAGYGYSNLMYITAGEVIRTVTGKSWSDNITERILKPLRMTRTLTTVKNLVNTDNYATPHRLRDDNNIPIEWANWDNVAATGGLISCAEDMAKWMIFNFHNGVIGHDTLFSKTSRNLMWTNHNNHIVDHTKENEYGRNFSGYGLGWGISDYHGHLRIGHTGGYDGMITAFTMLPDQKSGVIVLTNGMNSPIMAATLYVLDRLLYRAEKDWSAEMLESRKKRQKEDNRISYRKEKRILNTAPSLPLTNYTGIYHTDKYGELTIRINNNHLALDFSHSPDLSAKLSHWHHDVFKIEWQEEHAWFDFGTVQFIMNHQGVVNELRFDVPNDDIFFEEFHPILKK